jgi:hypothetical protein
MRVTARTRVRQRVRVRLLLDTTTTTAAALASGARQTYEKRSAAEMMAATPPLYFATAVTESGLVWLISRADDELQSSR